jgi:hypothetical protein
MGAVFEKHPPAMGDISCSRFSFKVGFRADFLALPLMRWKMPMH